MPNKLECIPIYSDQNLSSQTYWLLWCRVGNDLTEREKTLLRNPTTSIYRLHNCITASQPAIQPASQSASRPAIQPTSQPASQPAIQPTNQPTSQPASQPAIQPASQPASHPTNQPTSQPASHPATQPPIQPPSQSASQPAIQPASQPASHPTNQPTNQPASQPPSHPATHPATQSVSQPASRPATPRGSAATNHLCRVAAAAGSGQTGPFTVHHSGDRSQPETSENVSLYGDGGWPGWERIPQKARGLQVGSGPGPGREAWVRVGLIMSSAEDTGLKWTGNEV